ncbi:MAG: pilus assembly protein PilM [Candidatus Omnitrophica bacterium]|nr:pilus assembly protein PilM [Candidatus Omnitrophota bacterium]
MSKHVIGLSIAPHVLRLVEGVRDKNGCVITNAATAPVTDFSPEGLAKGLRQVLRTITAKRAEVICAVNLPDMYLGKIVTPKMPRRELAEAIRWEIGENLTFPSERAAIDYFRTETLRGGTGEKFSLLTAAVSRDAIDRIRSAFRLVNVDRELRNIRLAKIIPAPLAVTQLFRHQLVAAAEHVAVVHMDDHMISMVFLRECGLELFRRLPLAGKDITISMTKALVSPEGKIELSLSEAETFKRAYGIAERDSDQILDGKISGKQIYMLIRPQLEKLVNEIRRSVNFYAQKSGYPVRHVILSGPGAHIKGLVDYLGEQLDLNVATAVAANSLAVLPAVTSEYSGFGLDFDQATGAACHPPDEINWLSRQSTVSAAPGPSRVGYAVLLAVAAAVSLTYGWAQSERIRGQNQWEEARRQYDALQPRVDEVRMSVELASIAQDRRDWRTALQVISRIVPADIYFSEMWTEDNMLYIKGAVVGEADGESGVSGFMSALEGEACSKSQLLQVRRLRGEDKRTEFRIACEIPWRITRR